MKLFIFVLMFSMSVIADTTPPVCVPGPVPVNHKHHKRRVVKKVVPVPVVEKVCEACETKYVEKQVIVEKIVEAKPFKNRISLLGGQGPSDIDLSIGAKTATLGYKYGPVFGLGYERLLNNKYSIGAEVFTNSMWVVKVGVGF